MPRNAYLNILLSELRRRRRRNSQYSERAFARDLGISPSKLTEVFQGKQGLSRKTAESIGRKLHMSKADLQDFCDYVDAAHGRSERVRKLAQERLQIRDVKKRKRYLTSFEVGRLSDWYSFVILEMVKLKNFRGDSEWIAKRLGITKAEVERTVRELIQTKLLRIEDGKWTILYPDAEFVSTSTTEEISKSQNSVMDRAKVALRRPSSEHHFFYNFEIALTRREYAEIRSMVRELRDQVWKKVIESQATAKDSVYCLNFQLFDLVMDDGATE